MEVMIEFIGALEELVSVYDHIVPVLRGSVLMRHWFGARARPAADIDLEWFPLPGWTAQRHATPLLHARNLCLFAAGDHFNPPIVFDEMLPVPGDGVNLWDYETPGVRCYTGWTWTDRRLSGELQIDLATPASYDLPSIPAETAEFTRMSGAVAQVRAYTPEMLLAAKLSWIVRHVLCKPTLHAGDQLAFFGEPKDLFDAHLLVTEKQLRPEIFQQALLSIVLEDRLDWNQLEAFWNYDRDRISDHTFLTWDDFRDQFAELITAGPGEMLATIIKECGRLWDGFRPHVPFLRAIAAGSTDEANFLVYADWLEDIADARANFLRQFCRVYFHVGSDATAELKQLVGDIPRAWLNHVLGGSTHTRDFLQSLQ